MKNLPNRNHRKTCPRCGAPSHPNFAPACSSACAEWTVDSKDEFWDREQPEERDPR